MEKESLDGHPQSELEEDRTPTTRAKCGQEGWKVKIDALYQYTILSFIYLKILSKTSSSKEISKVTIN